jgi:hypothetical protein
MIISTVKIVEDGFLVNGLSIVPDSPSNIDYQLILDWIIDGNEPEGADIIEPDYVALRTGPEGYASLPEQLGMQTDGTWDAHVADVKTRFPKSNTGSVTIADVPQSLLDAAAAKLFAKQVEDYTKAKTRISQYQLSVGRPETSYEEVVSQEWDEELMEMQDVTETIVTPAIEPLDATIEVTTQEIDEEPVTTTVDNPLIVTDDAERDAAQLIIDNTPQEVKDQVDGV